VEFVHEEIEDDEAFARLLERCHSKWITNTEYNYHTALKPYWRLVVVNGTDAFFIYHHMIGDGLSGYAFHRSFLVALNAQDEEPGSPGLFDEVRTTVKSSRKSLQPPALDQIELEPSWLGLLLYHLINILRWFIRKKCFVFSDAKVSYHGENPLLQQTFTDIVSRRTVTRVQTLRIGHNLMQKCLKACRQHDTSFTGLLHTLIQVTLAVDSYPNAMIGFSRLAINLRPFLQTNPGRDVFTDAVSFMYRAHLLYQYRAAAVSNHRHVGGNQNQPETPSSSTPSSPQEPFALDVKVIWDLARVYKNTIISHLSPSGFALHDFASCKIFPDDDEGICRLYSCGLYQQNSFILSNLGVFKPREEQEIEDGWRIEDVTFSAAALKARLSDAAIAVNVASVKGGDCVITVSYEKGVLRDEMVREFLRGVQGRLEFLLS
jgi:hypothetical protein